VGKLSVVVPDDLEKRFRFKVLGRLGSKKGALSMAIAEAMELWIAHEEPMPKPK
jgi:hypothetical protein